MDPRDQYGLGRREHVPDARDRLYRAATLLQAEPVMRAPYKYFTPGQRLNQGTSSACTGHSARHLLSASPNRYKLATPDQWALYNGAQLHDEWPGEDYDGSSVRGAAKFMQKQGLLQSYLWAWNTDMVLDWVLGGKGPVMLGTNWYYSMFEPDKKGRIVVPAGARNAGGHAYLLYGANGKQGTVSILNSWGRGWGKDGTATMDCELLERLLQEDGEACMAIENPFRAVK